MFRMISNKKGFTLVELMVVAVIVAILAAVAIPLMMGNRIRAMASEAEAALGHIRTAMRAVYAQEDVYNPAGIAAGPAVLAAGNVPGIRARTATAPGDLDGRYFSEEAFLLTAVSPTGFTAQCTWDSSTDLLGSIYTPNARDVNTTGNTTTIDQLGNIVRAGY